MFKNIFQNLTEQAQEILGNITENIPEQIQNVAGGITENIPETNSKCCRRYNRKYS
ncbi:ring-infected erythrocyte surface antigen precursor [Lactococcus lactis subsp. lactis]|nr:ring-infected erythrocyte surface antigen precursor [Lactococcus lactis subsp. lactis]